MLLCLGYLFENHTKYTVCIFSVMINLDIFSRRHFKHLRIYRYLPCARAFVHLCLRYCAAAFYYFLFKKKHTPIVMINNSYQFLVSISTKIDETKNINKTNTIISLVKTGPVAHELLQIVRFFTRSALNFRYIFA